MAAARATVSFKVEVVFVFSVVVEQLIAKEKNRNEKKSDFKYFKFMQITLRSQLLQTQELAVL